MRDRTLRLIPLGPPHPAPELMHWLAAALRQAAGLAVLTEPPLRLADTEGTGRLSSNRLVDLLIDLNPPVGELAPAEWTLGVTAADLFVPPPEGEPGDAAPLHWRPELDYVFGEAALGGAWAVVSLARLGAPDGGQEILRERLLKEALHELGHVAGLPHCPGPACVMAASVDLADVDRKPAGYCPSCHARIAGLDPCAVDG